MRFVSRGWWRRCARRRWRLPAISCAIIACPSLKLRLNFLSRASEQTQLACVLICSQHLRNTCNPPSLPPHAASPSFQRQLAGHRHHPSQHATGSSSCATPPAALPEPPSISLRLHHCTSPTTTTTTPTHAPGSPLPSCVPPTPGLSDSHTHKKPTHHNVGDRS